MDDMNFQGEEMKALLKDLAIVNKWLGGTGITLSGIDLLLKKHTNFNKPLVVLDLGCGDGEMLRKVVTWGQQRNVDVRCIGLDANPFIIEEAIKRSKGYNTIEFKKIDVFSDLDLLPEFDIALCTLFLHHFQEKKIVGFLQDIGQKAKVGVVVNDLMRNVWAFRLFKLFGQLFLRTHTARHDGLVSIARGFRKKEILAMSRSINGTHSIKSKWAFRYQWLIYNT